MAAPKSDMIRVIFHFLLKPVSRNQSVGEMSVVRSLRNITGSQLRRLIHTELPYVPTLSDLEKLRKDAQEYEQKYITDEPISLQSASIAPPIVDSYFKPAAKTTRIQSHRMMKAADYVWALHESLSKQSEVPNRLMQEKFKSFESVMYAVNDTSKASLVSLDLKLANNSLRELGFAIYDSQGNQSIDSLPIIENHNIIVKDFHGVLSSNTFHGVSEILSLDETKSLLCSVLDTYFSEPGQKQAKLVGFDIPQLMNTLNTIGVRFPGTVADFIDIKDLYRLPFHYNSTLSEQPLLKYPKFLQLETVLNRLNLPRTFMISPGNKAYYQLVALLSMTNPYHRVKFKLDSIMGNYEFMESFLVNQLNDFLKQSEIQKRTKSSELSISTYGETQLANSSVFLDHESALLDAFKSQ